MATPLSLGTHVLFPTKETICLRTDSTGRYTDCYGFRYGIVVKVNPETWNNSRNYMIVEATTGNYITNSYDGNFRVATEQDTFLPPTCTHVATVCRLYGIEI